MNRGGGKTKEKKIKKKRKKKRKKKILSEVKKHKLPKEYYTYLMNNSKYFRDGVSWVINTLYLWTVVGSSRSEGKQRCTSWRWLSSGRLTLWRTVSRLVAV